MVKYKKTDMSRFSIGPNYQKPDQNLALKYANRLPSLIYFHINKHLNLHFSPITQSSKQEKPKKTE